MLAWNYMRYSLLLLPAVLMAQTAAPKAPAPRPKPAAAKAAPKASAAKKPAVAKSAAPAPKPTPAATPALTTDDDKTIYSLGLAMYRSLANFNLSPAEIEIVKQAISDAAAGKPAVEIATYGPKIQEFAKARAAKAAEKEKAVSNAYLEKSAAEPGAVKTASGMIYRDITPGTGAQPAATDTVKVHYRGTLVNGTEFDSSYKRNEPAQFPLNGVIRCWTEGVQKMKVGGKAQLVCPSDIAYGDQGRPGIPGGAALIFEIELLDIVKAAQ